MWDAMDRPPGQRFEYWLGATARRLREEAGLSLEDMASRVHASKEKLDRFEKGRTRPHNESEVVAGYAEVCGIADARDVYALALDDWNAHGQAPAAAAIARRRFERSPHNGEPLGPSHRPETRSG
jgi:transcriptional regulator with XRE-family HTH domain